MVQVNEAVVTSGARELTSSAMRPTIYRPSRPVVTLVPGGQPGATPVAVARAEPAREK